MSLILDSSATLAWIYGDETTEAIRGVFDAIADNGAVVPALWRLEIANSLTMAVGRQRIDPDFRRAALADLALLDITTDQQTDSYAWTDTLNLADHFGLETMIDARITKALARLVAIKEFKRTPAGNPLAQLTAPRSIGVSRDATG